MYCSCVEIAGAVVVVEVEKLGARPGYPAPPLAQTTIIGRRAGEAGKDTPGANSKSAQGTRATPSPDPTRRAGSRPRQAPDQNVVQYFMTDQLGSVRFMADAWGVAGRWRYDAYGDRSCVGDNCFTSSPFGYAGQYTDDESADHSTTNHQAGLLYLRGRYYDPNTQQFLTRDPIEATTGQPYVYAGANPINASDPSGQFLDTLADIASVGMDLKDIHDEGLNWGTGLTLGADVVLAAVPFFPSVAGWAKRGGKAAMGAANHADDVAGAAHAISTACGSFSADTLVATETGERPISTIQVGERVLAYDEASGTTGYYPVTAILVHDDPGIEHLTIDGEELETTPEHPFYTQEKGWVAAGELWEGAHIRKADGSFGLVECIELEQHSQKMYNLTVARAHTFFVGDGRWLVHNSCNAIQGMSVHLLPKEESQAVLDTLAKIDANVVPTGPQAKKWGTPFGNYEGHLPSHSGSYYKEHRVLLPGQTHGGVMRIVTGAGGERYYTWTHYGQAGDPPFVRIR